MAMLCRRHSALSFASLCRGCTTPLSTLPLPLGTHRIVAAPHRASAMRSPLRFSVAVRYIALRRLCFAVQYLTVLLNAAALRDRAIPCRSSALLCIALPLPCITAHLDAMPLLYTTKPRRAMPLHSHAFPPQHRRCYATAEQITALQSSHIAFLCHSGT